MNVFISWSKNRSLAVAEALRDLLPATLQHVRPWLSKRDIHAGDRWDRELDTQLENTNFGIICLTRENLSSPWILFEAGALSKFIDTGKVVPLLIDLDISDISGPLARFQAKKFGKSSVYELIQAINLSSDVPIDDKVLKKSFDKIFWPEIDAIVENIPPPDESDAPVRDQKEILEDLVVEVRNLKSATIDLVNSSDQVSPTRKILNEQEIAILNFLYEGKSFEEISKETAISISQIKIAISNIVKKLNIFSTTGLKKWYEENMSSQDG